ncbi:hypothetical protein CCM_04675 [Cordyceps militaris CM01]|uniref:Uncharacterized protein n=1 Tax=Cordyceps militaris (strain CM01) TaxID=983644 RepID=G3JGN3_CORMM|nr:uncharacterized protein CCM_04675 [Cordyceps militaris CM01]EGX93302.1 hypothetical protein CCM_04675 [Cordyceps militaris CM01]
MAFQQPARQPAQRVVRPSVAVEPTQQPPAALQERALDQSQTSWVLFSPPTDVTTASYLSETDHSVDTPGRSRASGLGSVHTAARSSPTDDFRLSLASSAIDDISVDDDAELDSLDSHLPEFRSQPGDHAASHRNTMHGAVPVFPAHDGLGSFRLDRPTLGRDAQEQIYQFERFNPKRLRVDTADDTYMETGAAGEVQESAKRERIEAWRLEHSRVLLDEVQRETRRRRKSLVSMHRRHQSQSADDNMTWHDEDDATATEASGEDRGFLARITRTVVKDIFGIDEKLLDILLGEAVVDEDDLSNTPRASQLNTPPPLTSLDEESWQLRILESVSRELGRLVNHLSPHHPGAFSTYSRMQQMPLPYAGLPAIPEAADQASVDHPSAAPSAPEFKPTLDRHSQPIPIPGKTKDESEDSGLFTKDEWERDLDIKLVFRYLISRFTSRNNTPSNAPAHMATTSMQDAAARVARVRQHHPLIARARPMERRPFRAVTPSSPIAARPRSSCASQSTRRSARRSSTSSRHYWDIGGSLGTGSMIGPQGPVGSWGEV